jgi:hypothetical protein
LGFDEISRDHLAEQLSGWSEAVCMDLIHAPTPVNAMRQAIDSVVAKPVTTEPSLEVR